ncbi:MAG: hypothetical protein K0S65_2211, partial [Labilithrix sp.]|nr:hypothetical protein [Labilithrix sp.]
MELELLQVQLDGLLPRTLVEPGFARLLLLDDREVSRDRALDGADLVEQRLLRERDLLIRTPDVGVVVTLASGDEVGTRLRGLLVLLAELSEERVREELGGGDLVGVLGGDLRELVVPRGELLTTQACAGERAVVLLHLHADHLRQVVDVRGGQVILLLELVERVLRLLELVFEMIELTGEPDDGVARRADHLLEIVIDVRLGDGLGETPCLRRLGVLDLQIDEAAALRGFDGEATAQALDGLLHRCGRLRLVAEELGVVLQTEVANDGGEHPVALDDPVLGLVVLLGVPDGAPADERIGLVAERLDDVGIELDQRRGLVDLRDALRVRERDSGGQQDGGEDDRPVLEDRTQRPADRLEGVALAAPSQRLVLLRVRVRHLEFLDFLPGSCPHAPSRDTCPPHRLPLGCCGRKPCSRRCGMRSCQNDASLSASAPAPERRRVHPRTFRGPFSSGHAFTRAYVHERQRQAPGSREL